MTRILLAGESWISVSFEVKGRNVTVDSSYHTAADHLIAALEANDATVDHQTCETAWTDFPCTHSELKKYDLIILSDIGADTLQLTPAVTKGVVDVNRCRLLKEYVQTGGALGMVGGYMSFSGKGGMARYKNTALADVLPVEMVDGDDRVERPAGVIPDNHHALAELPSDWPPILGYNRLHAKPESDIWATVTDDPLIVVGKSGRGRTFAFATDCAPHWAPPQFLEWKGLPILWGEIIEWVTK